MSVPIEKKNKTEEMKEKSASEAEAGGRVSETQYHPLFALRREIDRLFEDMFPSPSLMPFRRWGIEWPGLPRLTQGAGALSATLKSDVSETDKDYVIRVELPGMCEDDVEVTVHGGVLTVTGEKRSEREEQETDYHLSECSYGSMRRSYRLPEEVDSDQATAEFDHGVLTLSLPKTEGRSARKITIKSKGK